ncbi:GntR family transcriptional regulator [Niallia oryzisoli]|uniref:GntR family transcriptional regulator n=1 Tax=Niallia oryzisoli TaxID=1737571 RepID=A0ABZ2CBF3_9BACI
MSTTQTRIAYEFIKRRILNGVFKPSQKLTENKLAEEINVSRNTVKKALMMLEKENLVYVETNKGATIKSFTLEEMLNYLEVREVLEGLIGRKAALNITDHQLLQLEELYNEMSTLIKQNSFDEYSKKNRMFHQIIYEASENPEAVKMINTIKTQLNRYYFRTILVPGRKEQSIKEHGAILKSLQSRDPVKCEEAVKKHVMNLRELIQGNYNYLV